MTETKTETKTETLRCPHAQCNARIITRASQGTVSISTDIQFMTRKDVVATDQFLMVNDVWDFDNVGVSRPTEDFTAQGYVVERLIVCSECDRGPLGFAFYEGEDKDVKLLKYAVYLGSFAP